MIDHLDKQTQPMDLEPKRGRGRPATGQALSNADRQRAYRERQKAQRNEIERELHNAEATLRCDESYTEGVWQELEQARTRIAELEKELNEAHLIMADQSIRTTTQIQKLKKELASRNEKPAKARKHRDDAPLKTILEAHNLMEERRKSGELSDMDALWRFVGATLTVIEQHGITTPK